jgi:hypothetical protein
MNTRTNYALVLSIVLATGLFLSGCATTRQLTLTDFQTGQTLVGEINESSRLITVTMPDGEILTGTYSAVTTSSPVYETGVGVGTGSHTHGAVFGTGIAFGGGASKGYGLLRSNISGLMMEVVISYSEWTNHGYGEATTNDGRKYKVQF